MKSFIKLFVGVFALGLCVSLAADNISISSSAGPANPDSAGGQTLSSGFNNQQIIETWGWIIAHESDVANIEISEAELAAFSKGLAAGFKDENSPYNTSKISPDVKRMAKARREKLVRAIIEKNQAEAKLFFTELEKNTNVFKLSGGVRYQVIKPGTGPYPKPQQTVNVHCIGHLLNGFEFTQTSPDDRVLWTNRFSSYLFKGLQKINKGGSMILYVPSPSEREVEMLGIPPGSVMVFEVELLDLKDTPPDALAEALRPPAPEPGPPPPSGYSKQQVLETWGWDIARKTHVSSLGLSEAELSLLTKGLIAGVKGQPPPYDLEKIQPEIEKFINDRREQAQQAFKQKQMAETEAFFAGLKQNTNVVELPSGLRYEILRPGSGPYPVDGKTVKVVYVGRLLNGKVFDSTDDPTEPNDVDISNHPRTWWVDRGMTEGVQKINKGGKIKLYVPPQLGYGDSSGRGAPKHLPPYSTLIYEIEVKDIIDMPPPDDSEPASKATSAEEKK
jgi:FKBP-type peptidyl-prolyl cis-trans isomerase